MSNNSAAESSPWLNGPEIVEAGRQKQAHALQWKTVSCSITAVLQKQCQHAWPRADKLTRLPC